MTEDDIEEFSQDLWKECMNCRKYEESFVMLREYMKLLHDTNKGFEYELFLDSSGTCTGCIWQTDIMRDNFDKFGGSFSIDAIKTGLNKLMWPYVSVTIYNDTEKVFVGCEVIVCY